ncbi:MAG: carboxypeptidase regulatory-like domain-containing protein, partial [Planctomycetota bacterium]
GAGIPDALVRIEALDAPAEATPIAQARTNKTGDIKIKLPKPADSNLRVRIVMQGYVEFVQEIDPTDPDDPPFIDATLQGASQITGTVRQKANDKPVAGARVICENGGRQLETATDEQGRYLNKNIYRGQTKLTVRADGFAIEQKMIVVQSEKTEADLLLEPEKTIQLTIVTNEDKPAPNVNIEAVVEPKHHYLNATTDDKGKAVLHGIGSDAEALTLRLNGDRYVYMPHFAKKITLQQTATAPATVSKKLMVAIAGKIQGKVIDENTQEPIVGVRIVSGTQLRSDMPMVWSSLDGTYQLTGLQHGPNIISFQHPNYATVVNEIKIYYGKTTQLDAQLNPGYPIGGTVTDDKDKPLQQVWVSADDWQGYKTIGLRTITDEDGKFFFPNAPTGDIKFSFRSPGCGQKPILKTMTAGKKDYRIVLETPTAPPTPETIKPKIETGQTVPDLKLIDMDGKTYQLAQLRGKYVFIDCWATWCGPCIAEIPNVKALRKAIQDRPDFILIGVSVDTDREALKKAIEKYQLDWPQVVGPKSGAREAFETLNGIGIPYTCLIGPDGKIIDQNLRGPNMTEKVKKEISKNKK